MGKAEPALVVAMYFHTCTAALSIVPLLLHWPVSPVQPGAVDTALLLGIAATSFFGQLLLTRGFQLEPAGRAAGLNFSQV